MAAFDALCTPRSTSLAAMLPHSGAQTQRLLFSSSPSAELRSTSLSVSDDEAFSSDKENSPLRTSRKQHPCSNTTAMNSVLQISPPQHHVSFTPQRVRPLPRAWERRPATPFVSRNDGQKIWKRMPLQELSIDPNQQMLKCEKEEKQNYLRATKKIRLDIADGVLVSEECRAAMSVVGTRWEEENIENGGSPKKKLRVQLDGVDTVSTSSMTSKESLTEQLTCPLEQGTQVTREETLAASPDVFNSHIIPPVDGSGADRGHMHDQEEAEEKTPAEQGLVSGHANDEDGSPLQATTTSLSGNEAHSASVRHHGEAIVFVPAAVVSDDGTAGFIAKEATQVYLVTPESLAQTSMVNESDVPRSLKTIPPGSMQESISDTQGGDCVPPSTVASSTQTMLVFTGSDHEDTAFLRDFLERAQASKAAKTTLSPQKKDAPSPFVTEGELGLIAAIQPEDVEAVDEIEDDDLSPPIETVNKEQMYAADDLVAGSPTRRSARTSTRATSSRLPRFQVPSVSHLSAALPGTIQLKRATGNEFIFNAKSQQTLAMTTRSNTKRNQYGSIYVTQRLAQLKAELEVRQQVEIATGTVSEPEINTGPDTCDVVETDLEAASKKRKRDKQRSDQQSKRRKSVRWPCDEDLARYREPSPTDDSLDTRSGIEEALRLLLPLGDDEQPDTAINVTSSAESANTLVPAGPEKKAESSTESSKHKVRRIRKIKLDSVNGTPAPKTRSRALFDSGTSETGGNQPLSTTTTSTLAPVSSSNVRKSSRMPVPVSTSVPLPSFTANKLKARSSEQGIGEREKAICSSTTKPSTGATIPEVSSSTKKTVVAPAESERRLDGRRRLRARG